MIEFIPRSQCPLCGTAHNPLLLDRPLSDTAIQAYLEKYYGGRVPSEVITQGRYQVAACGGCGALYQASILNEQGIQALYENWIQAEGSFQKRHETSLGQRLGYARQVVQIIKAVKRPPHEIAVLDFGMGWGTWLLMVRAFGMQACGLELSAERRQYAQKQGLQVVNADEIAPASLDFINAEQVFEHLTEPATVLKQCHGWLKPQGLLRIAVPNGAQTAASLQKGAWQVSDTPSIPLEHINIFTPASLRHFGTLHGFKPLQPPLVLPSWGLNGAEIKQMLGVLGLDVASRLGLYRHTVLWLQKVVS